ncbi:MAG: response regulator, partial [Anaerolineae bacterium]
SEVGKGATFKIYLPRAEGAVSPATVNEAAATVAGGAERLLVVEDDEAVRKLATEYLSRLGYKVTPARDGAEALGIVQEQGLDPDLVLTDVIMPTMNGKDLVDRLRQTRPSQKVIYMSGYTERAVAHAMHLDSNTLLVEKPFNLNDLAAKIRQLLDQPAAGNLDQASAAEDGGKEPSGEKQQ